ncbi:GlsB/YeaQ/YmgE family stress response membrane protein [Ktedonobacter robiniae]|uniref:Transglycosylase n=1 Tax=Ktedonobacter robiniae TaxID=2778365 RepID=A0ABQ3V2X3_9CHLR|nr:GlsB/YeaQ/YmgE family stress response membrane protein [Ktedonobacter robiniae]GHO59308.1 transglycosylase [Ktedonobacter robiniae]
MFTQATLVLAALDLTSIVWWLLVGLIAGFLASVVMRGGGYGIVGDIVVGLIGAFIGGFLASLVGMGSSGFIGTIIIAFIGACVLIALLRLVSRGTARRY